MTWTTAHLIIAATDLLVPIALATVWLALVPRPWSWSVALGAGALMLLALAWGAAWVWHPPLATLRLNPPPFGQAGAILSVVAVGAVVAATLWMRRATPPIDPWRLLRIGPWRIVFGSALLMLGFLGALPPAFFVSAALGDIAVGLASIWLMRRPTPPSARALLAWNLIGLADLMHVLAVGSATLRPFYQANPEQPALNLLPLAGVPVFLVVHLLTLVALARLWPGRTPSHSPVT